MYQNVKRKVSTSKVDIPPCRLENTCHFQAHFVAIFLFVGHIWNFLCGTEGPYLLSFPCDQCDYSKQEYEHGAAGQIPEDVADNILD